MKKKRKKKTKILHLEKNNAIISPDNNTKYRPKSKILLPKQQKCHSLSSIAYRLIRDHFILVHKWYYLNKGTKN